MIKPQTVNEQLLFSTARIQNGQSIGTGFFFSFKVDDKTDIPVIVTNKHVVAGAEYVNFAMHEAVVEDSKHYPSGEFMRVNYKSKWIDHPNSDVDLCITPVQPLISEVKKQKKEIFYTKLNEDIIWSDDKLEELSVVEDVLMVGYPIGLWDEVNNLPLVRKGITSTHPAINFQGKSTGAVDIACFGGSSGSPILIVNQGAYATKKGTIVGSRTIFLGVLFSGPFYNSEGEIVIKNIPTVEKSVSINKTMVNLGFYIKAKEILALKTVLMKYVDGESKEQAT